MNHTAGKMKFLAVKLSSLQRELEISKEILHSAGKEVDKMFQQKYFPEIPVDQDDDSTEVSTDPTNPKESPQEHTSEESSTESSVQDDLLEICKPIQDPETKRLFRKISLKIHPDKLIGLEDESEKEKKNELYLKAMRAAEENDIIILANIAISLGIDPPEISEQKLKEAENKISDIKKEINRIESTVVWKWFFCSDKKEKENILRQLFEFMYGQKNNNPGS